MKKLIELLEQSISILNQEIVTLRNDVVLQRIEVEKLKARLDEINQNKMSKTTTIAALIAATGAVIVGIIEYFKK